MRPGKRLPAAMLAALIISGGCQDMDETGSVPTALADSRWLAEDIDGAGVTDLARSTIEFLRSGKIAGNTGCNRYTAPLALVGDGIRVGPIAATRMACPPALMQQEQRFTKALAAAQRYALDGPYLLIFDAAGEQRLRLARFAGTG